MNRFRSLEMSWLTLRPCLKAFFLYDLIIPVVGKDLAPPALIYPWGKGRKSVHTNIARTTKCTRLIVWIYQHSEPVFSN